MSVRLQEYFNLQNHLSKTKVLEKEDKQLINILFLFQIIFCHVFGNFTEILVSIEEAAQNSCYLLIVPLHNLDYAKLLDKLILNVIRIEI